MHSHSEVQGGQGGALRPEGGEECRQVSHPGAASPRKAGGRKAVGLEGQDVDVMPCGAREWAELMLTPWLSSEWSKAI